MSPELLKATEKPRAANLLARVQTIYQSWRWLLLLLFAALILCEISWLAYLAATEADIVHYECYGLTFWLGSHGANLLPAGLCSFIQHPTPQPLRMLPEEYPPLTILPFSLPLLFPLPDYAFIFALFMTLVAALIYWLLARSEARRAGPIYLFYLLIGALGVAQQRFDLLPAACTLLCLLAAERGRWRAAYLALALGVLLKLYPIVLLPALFLAEQRAWLAMRESGAGIHGAAPIALVVSPRRAWKLATHWRWQNCLLFVCLLIVVMGGFALLDFTDAIINPLSYFLTRPSQIESLAGSVTWLGGLFGAPAVPSFDHGSLNIASDLTRLISPINTLLAIAGLFAIYWLHWRKRIDLAQSMVGLVCVLIVTGKVFSPQYLIWLIPLLAYVYARGQTNRLWMAAWALICLLTTFIYIFYYSRLPDPRTAATTVQSLPGFFEFVAARNLLLLLTAVVFVGGWWGVRQNKNHDCCKTAA